LKEETMVNATDEPRDPMADTAVDAAATEAPAYGGTAVAPPRTYERPLPPPLPPLPPPGFTLVETKPPQAKAPVLAVLLSFFPGLGQLYNEQPAKAITFFFAFVGSIYGAAEISPFPFAFLIPFVWFYNLIDAWITAGDINKRARAGDYERKDTSFESPLWGGTLLGLGLLLLLNNMGWLRLAAFARYWPLVLVVVGAAFLLRALRARQAAPARGSYDDRPL
jgi:TM2 domain-containing membrane protein YozV